MRYANGDVYKGTWCRGYPFGIGRIDYNSGGYYHGQYVKMTEAGRYEKIDEFGDSRGHSSQFSDPNGLRHGRGRCVYSNGNQVCISLAKLLSRPLLKQKKCPRLMVFFHFISRQSSSLTM